MARKPDEVKKDRRLRVLWSSNSPHSNSGYGTFTKDLLFRMRRDGWEVACNAFWGIQGYPAYLYGHDLIDDRFKDVRLKLYPMMADAWGADGMLNHGKDWKTNVTFCMQDIWPLDPNILQQLPCWISYCPVDKSPVPPLVAEKLKLAYKILSFSEFGRRELEKAGFYSTLILEGTDTEIFKPMDKLVCRRDLKLPLDAFVFGMVAANKENPPRKGFQEALEAFKMFQDKHPEAALMIHTQQPGPGGFPIKEFAHDIGINMNQLFFMEPYKAVFGSDSHVIAQEMNAMDILLHPSQTEGFGLTVIEAASCGIPAIVSNNTSQPEMIVEGVTGEIVKTRGRRYTNDLSWVEPADVDDLYLKMETLYTKVKADPGKIARDCREHIVKNYDIEVQYRELWTPLLESLQKKLLPPL